MRSKQKRTRASRTTGAPFLRRIETLPDKIDPAVYPFNIRAFSRGIDLALRSKVTFFVGENGAGKSTLLEALAEVCGFTSRAAIGNFNSRPSPSVPARPGAPVVRAAEGDEGYFMRAESFYNVAT